MRLRRIHLIALALAIVTVAAVLGVSLALDPGSKNDRSTGLVTPTLSASGARRFAVAADESGVEFVAAVRGMSLAGVFPVEKGTITLEPVGDQLRVLVSLEINVDGVETANPALAPLLRAAMDTGDYPIAFYVATSRGLVPVTEEEVAFELEGDLDVHNVVRPHAMQVRAQLIGGDMWAVATSPLDLGEHGVEFPAILGSTAIELTARLQAYEVTTP
jgi:polyisoprenoid-binding protein YceI